MATSLSDLLAANLMLMFLFFIGAGAWINQYGYDWLSWSLLILACTFSFLFAAMSVAHFVFLECTSDSDP